MSGAADSCRAARLTKNYGYAAMKLFLSFVCLLSGLCPHLTSQMRQGALDVTARTLQTYSASPAVKVKPTFVPLPPGAVSPQGWLRDWAIDSANGITGHLDEYSTTYAQAWKGGPVNGMRANPDGTGWPLNSPATGWTERSGSLTCSMTRR